MRKLIIVLALFLAPVAAFAQPGSGSAPPAILVDAGSGSGSGSATPAPPSAVLNDPYEDPAGAISDVKDAKKKGWLPLILVVAYGLARLLGKLGENVAVFHKLGEGRVAMVVATSIAGLAAAVDALALGGNPLNVLYVAGLAVIGFLNASKGKPKAAKS